MMKCDFIKLKKTARGYLYVCKKCGITFNARNEKELEHALPCGEKINQLLEAQKKIKSLKNPTIIHNKKPCNCGRKK